MNIVGGVMMKQNQYIYYKDTDALESISFMIYKVGIDGSNFEEINKKIIQFEENNNKNDEYYETFLNVKKLYVDYWSDYFDVISRQFKEAISNKYTIVSNSDYSFGFEIVIEKDYILKYCYEQRNNEEVIYHFHLMKVLDYLNKESNFLLRLGELESEKVDGKDHKSIDLYKNKSENEYDCKLEDIKIEIMNLWIKLIKSNYKCFWIEDSQSHKLSVDAYSKLNYIENKLRTFISIILIRNKGIDWDKELKKTMLSNKITENKRNRSEKDKFNEIDSSMFSINMRDLTKIMNHKVKNYNLEKKIDSIIPLVHNIKNTTDISGRLTEVDKLIDFITVKETNITSSYWNDYFQRLFDVVNYDIDQGDDVNQSNNFEVYESGFKDDWQKLSSMRNSIAHNKLIDHNYFVKLVKLIDKIDHKITGAEIEFFNDNNIIHDFEDDYYYSGYSYKNKYEREFIIYCKIAEFLFDISEVFEKNEDVILKLDEIKFITIPLGLYSSYEFISDRQKIIDEIRSTRKKDFDKYLKIILKESSYNIIEIESDSKTNTFFKIHKYAGSQHGALTSYKLEVYMSNQLVKSVNIGCDTRNFVCNGIDEENEFLGGEWKSFKHDIMYLLEITYIDKSEIDEIGYDNSLLSFLNLDLQE